MKPAYGLAIIPFIGILALIANIIVRAAVSSVPRQASAGIAPAE